MPPSPEWLEYLSLGIYEPVLRRAAVITGDELRRPRKS